jgi:cell division protein FtsW (lipid II flippase)
VFLVILGVRLLKARQAGRAVQRALAIVAIVGVFGVAAFAALPVQSRYFVSRITATTQTGSVAGDTNLQNRMDKLRRVYTWIGSESHVLGQGYVTIGQEPTSKDIRWMSADLVWVPVLYRLGLLGVAAVLLLYGAAGWRALRMSFNGDGEAEFVALVVLGALVGTFLEGLFSFSFLNDARYPMGLWLFALLAAEACRRRAESAALVSTSLIGGRDAT